MRLLTAGEMRAADKAAAEIFGIPGLLLMENAALALLRELEDMLAGEPLKGRRVIIFCGAGNNGGDGFALCRQLLARGAAARCFLFGAPERLTGDAKTNYDILARLNAEPRRIEGERQLDLLKPAVFSADIIVDAIFGTGFRGPLSGTELLAVEMLNASGRRVLAADIPSGLDAQSGLPQPRAVRAERTVTFAYAQPGLVLPAAAPYVGRLRVAEICLPKAALEQTNTRLELTDADFCRRWLARRERDGHKGDYGRVLVLGGCGTMPGAPGLAAQAALRGGAGLVLAASTAAVCESLAAHCREATLLPLKQNRDHALTADSLEKILEQNCDAMVIGPGLGRNEETGELVRALLPRLRCPAVIDADALFFLQNERELIRRASFPLIFTPHAGEFARLTGLSVGEIAANRMEAATAFAAEYGVILILKGAGTVVADPDGRVFLSGAGNPGMATGGSGDVLAGLLAALLGQKLPPAAAAAAGVYLHALAGDIAAAQKSEFAMTAADIIEALPAAFKAVAG